MFFDSHNEPSLSSLHICGEVDIQLVYLYKQNELASGKEPPKIVSLGADSMTDIVKGFSNNEEDDGLHILNLVYVAESPKGVVVTTEVLLELSVYNSTRLAELRQEQAPPVILSENTSACRKMVRVGEEVTIEMIFEFPPNCSGRKSHDSVIAIETEKQTLGCKGCVQLKGEEIQEKKCD